MMMEKRNNAAPELMECEENFKTMMKEMEEDEKNHSFEIPEKWDQEFRGIIDHTYRRDRQRRVQRVGRRVGVVAGVFSLIVVTLFSFPETVQGASLLELLQKKFGFGEKEYVTFGTNGENEILSAIEQEDINFDTTSLESAYVQIRQILSEPMFYITYIPEGYILTEAKYDSRFEVLKMRLEKDNNTVYIVEQRILNENTAGTGMKNDAAGVVVNDNIKQEVVIYKGEQDDSLSFNIKNSYKTLSYTGTVTLEECEKIAESIYYK